MEYRALGSTGMKVSALSFGASSLGAAFRKVTEKECIETVHTVLESGINFIDVSPAYGETLAETNLGKGLRGIPRDRYYLATKVGSYSEPKNDYDYSAKRTRESLHASLERLGVDYLDIVQCHDIEFADHDQILGETLPCLRELKEEGLLRHIGITGLPLGIFRSILDRDATGIVETVLSFCHYELNDTTLAGLLPYIRSKGVGVINASPTGMGLLTDRGAPDWHPASPEIREGCAKAVAWCRERGVDITRLALQFCYANKEIATTLVGSANPDNMRRNVACVEEEPDMELFQQVQEILAPVRDKIFTRGLPEHRDDIQS